MTTAIIIACAVFVVVFIALAILGLTS